MEFPKKVHKKGEKGVLRNRRTEGPRQAPIGEKGVRHYFGAARFFLIRYSLIRFLIYVSIVFMKSDILSRLSGYLFWDLNIDMLDPDIDKKLILERVFTRGTENDEKEVFNYYGMSLIKSVILSIKYLDKKTLNYLSVIFGIPKEEFECCKNNLSGNSFGIF